ncbi:MAG TPA: SDR family NAD(P)-dependent oxidoreductase [Thermoleophilaceae bacterium]|nr:SDR family NAD(P)-dependent oxidoreductase [Thermoleophilaceae bacterium]
MSTALVTGAARGIGRAIALRLASDGWAVAACDRDSSVQAPPGGSALVFDVTDAAAVTDAFASLDSVDAVVANAAIVDNIADADRLSAEAWRREVDVNLTGAFLTVQPAIAPMRERGSGRIVVISSGAATGGLRGQVSYSAAKAGLLGMVRTLALELAPSGVTVNAVLPGMVETENVKAMPAEVRERVMGHVPVGRFAEPDEVAAVVSFLCSPDASYITGACIPVDGAMGLTDLTLGRERR